MDLTPDVAALVESWMGGVTWRQLCKETSLDQGDICRMLRRTVELLRQLPRCQGLSPRLALVAQEAAEAMDRFPVADLAMATEERPVAPTILDPLTGAVLKATCSRVVSAEDRGEAEGEGDDWEEEGSEAEGERDGEEDVLEDIYELIDQQDGEQDDR